MTKKIKILIIGAGMSGLAAARMLVANNYEVTILEARDRIGGRTWTEEICGAPFDLGAFIIHGIENNPVTDLACQFNVNFTSLDSQSLFINLKQQLSSAQFELIQQQFDMLLADASEYAQQATTDMSLIEAMNAIKTNAKYSALSKEIYAWKTSFLTLYTGSEPKFLSARNWDRDELWFEGGNHLILNGFKPIVQGLAQDLRIILNTKVNKINYHSAGVRIDSDNGTYHADAVIVTLPLGVLKKGEIKFDPPLPSSKTEAINRLEMGVLNKIILQFPEIFWQLDQPNLTYLTQTYTSVSRFINGYYYFKQPILITAIGGNTAREFEKMTMDEVNNAVMAVLRNCYGNAIPNPVASQITRWHQDPYTYGSYSYIPIGASGADYDILAQPIDNKIFFAGEATHRQFPGTVHGAYLSGVRAAEWIMGISVGQLT